MRRGVSIILYGAIYKKSRGTNSISLSNFPRTPYRCIPHSLLPSQIVGSSQDSRIIPLKTFTHLHPAVILTMGPSNLSETEDLRRGWWMLSFLYTTGFHCVIPKPEASASPSPGNLLEMQISGFPQGMLNQKPWGWGPRNLCFNKTFRLTFENFSFKPSFQQPLV